MTQDLDFLTRTPTPALADVVESFWMLTNRSADDKPVIILPDGRIDLSFSSLQPTHFSLLGLESQPGKGLIRGHECMMAVSFRPLAIEYMFGKHTTLLTNTFYQIPLTDFDFRTDSISGFDMFVERFTEQLVRRLPADMDIRKKRLFDALFASGGSIRIAALAGQIGWSQRQINRYFTEHFGLSLKTYCAILRFRATFGQLKEGRLFPEQHFTDQSHFIREVRKFAGVPPKELARNQNDHFIQFSVLPDA
nr:AraC family transcriptional regulator [uncultured Arsenicibacter sp.]